MTTYEQLLLKIQSRLTIIDSCWLYLGSIDKNGYAKIYVDGKTHQGHRIMYTLKNSLTLSPRTHVHHICKHKNCINPDHAKHIGVVGHTILHKTKVSQEVRLGLKAEYLSGLSIKEIAALHNISQTRVRTLLLAYGTMMREAGRGSWTTR